MNAQVIDADSDEVIECAEIIMGELNRCGSLSLEKVLTILSERTLYNDVLCQGLAMMSTIHLQEEGKIRVNVETYTIILAGPIAGNN